jgi:secretion/DNA translocation related TadE-like protein
VPFDGRLRRWSPPAWPRWRQRRRAESGAASVVTIAILGATVGLAAGVVGVLGVSVAIQSASNAADASALAAADAVSGAVAGEPCGLAAALAERNRAVLMACEADGPAVVVSVVVEHGPIRATASARAGPPGWSD